MGAGRPLARGVKVALGDGPRPAWGMEPSLVQTAVWLLLLVAALAWPLLGHWPRAGGTYAEAGHAVHLSHMGPLVWGHCVVPGGEERYAGFALMGRLVLRRYDHGAQLLAGRGFPRDQLRALEGSCTGLFRLQLTPEGNLAGAFYGRRFTMEHRRMVPKDTLEPVSRLWRRTT